MSDRELLFSVRIVHKASGAVGEARDSKHQAQNKQAAFKRMVAHPKFRVWKAEMIAEVISGKTLDERVDEAMMDHNLRVEVRGKNGKWATENN